VRFHLASSTGINYGACHPCSADDVGFFLLTSAATLSAVICLALPRLFDIEVAARANTARARSSSLR